uniref:uncharacterized protein n=1 Tax=Myxine glutinosa TaxID=7769 RepID=UPI00358E2E41
MPWTKEEKLFCVTTYLETKSFKTVQAKFRRKFNFNNYPQKNQVYRWAHTFQATGSVNNLNKKAETPSSGRKLTARSPDNVNAVRPSVGRSPKRSIRRRSQEQGLSRASVQRILIKDLQLYPYKIQIKHKLTPADMAKRVVMCRWFENKIEEDPDFLDDVWFSDEAHFLLCGHVNSKNNVFWGTQAPDEVLQRPLHSVKCTAWVAISKHGIIGPFWFEDADEEAVTVTKERYIVVLNKFWRGLGRRRGMNRDVQWFQQDGATPHTANVTMEWLDHRFPDRLISRRREPELSPHSPDLNPPNFYLWGFLKDHVYENRPQSISELKVAITQKIRAIRKEECVRVIDNFARRLQVCLRRKGGHLEHLL